jgi:hypothetical protein
MKRGNLRYWPLEPALEIIVLDHRIGAPPAVRDDAQHYRTLKTGRRWLSFLAHNPSADTSQSSDAQSALKNS